MNEEPQVLDAEHEDMEPREPDFEREALPVHVGSLAVTPQVTAHDLVKRLDVIKDALAKAMEKDVDYGVIPGTGTKPTLLKPGAEKLGVLFQLDVQLRNEKTWHDDGHLTVVSHATVFHAPTGARLGYGEGICSTREKKYAKRKVDRVCPRCGETAVIKGKAEYGGGWLCWKKRGGCGAKFADGAEEIESQAAGDIDNPDLADTYNTVDKMASKRARIDAVLAVTGASAIFTQDLEDFAATEPAPEPAPEPDPISDEQATELEGLLNDRDVEGPDVALCMGWARGNLTADSAAQTIAALEAGGERGAKVLNALVTKGREGALS